MVVNLIDLNKANRIVPLFRLAFRSFFLGGAMFSLIALGLWGVFWMQGMDWNPYGGWIWWHSHEMLFGFVAAIIVGFLLTAVQNWTGIESIHSWPLAGLFTVWLLPRIFLLFPYEPIEPLLPWLDLVYLPLAAWVMGRMVWKVRQMRNLFFVPVLLLLAVINAQMHWAVNHGDGVLAKEAARSAIFVIVFVMTVLGGRVIPFFTANGTGTSKATPIVAVEILSMGSVAVLALLQLAGVLKLLPTLLVAVLFLLAGAVHLVRFLRWRPWITLKVPLLWSLHMAYLFIVLGFFLAAARYAGLSLDVFKSLGFQYATILHSFTLGGMGLLIVGMMARVSLGHTGRPLAVSSWMSLAFLAVVLAYLCRVWLPLLVPDLSHYWSHVLSIVLWLLGYGLFVVIYLPILSKPRVDGRPG